MLALTNGCIRKLDNDVISKPRIDPSNSGGRAISQVGGKINQKLGRFAKFSDLGLAGRKPPFRRKSFKREPTETIHSFQAGQRTMSYHVGQAMLARKKGRANRRMSTSC